MRSHSNGRDPARQYPKIPLTNGMFSPNIGVDIPFAAIRESELSRDALILLFYLDSVTHRVTCSLDEDVLLQGHPRESASQFPGLVGTLRLMDEIRGEFLRDRWFPMPPENIEDELGITKLRQVMIFRELRLTRMITTRKKWSFAGHRWVRLTERATSQLRDWRLR